jgi:hypothetical protein
MAKDKQREQTQGSKKDLQNDPMMIWKNLKPLDAFNDLVQPWMAYSTTFVSDQSVGIKDFVDTIKPYFTFNLEQQEIFVDMTDTWMTYLTALMKNQKESQKGESSPMTACNGTIDASKDLLRSCIALMDREMEALSAFYQATVIRR